MRVNYLITTTLLFLYCFCPLSGKETKINITKTVVYVGEAVQKTPRGDGTLYVMSAPSKTLTGKQDRITGTFNGNMVSDATLVFASGWCFQGNVNYAITETDKKAGITEVVYKLTGDLKNEDDSFSCALKNVMMIRTNSSSGGFDLNVKAFEAMRKNASGEEIPFMIELTEENESWQIDAQQHVSHAVFFKGSMVSKKPEGEGVLFVNDNDIIGTPLRDEIRGFFNQNHVSDANIIFSSGWTFKGDVDYLINPKSESPYETDVEYLLWGVLTDTKGEAIKCDSLLMTRKLSPGKILLEDITLTYEDSVPDRYLADYQRLTLSSSATCMKTLKIWEKDGWDMSDGFSAEEPEFSFDNGFIITKTKDGFICQYPNMDYFIVKNNAVVDLVKTYQECRVRQAIENKAEVVYYNGDIYQGTFQIDSFSAGDLYNQNKIIDIMTGHTSINYVPLLFKNGKYTYQDGKYDDWKGGITDYQLNKKNGNYEKALASAQEYIRQERVASGRALEQKWQKEMPALKANYSAKDVDAIYQYRLNRGTDLNLFLRLSELGLINLSPFYVNANGSYKRQYVISVYNRETGEIQYSQILKFKHPNIYSTRWILEAYSSNFM